MSKEYLLLVEKSVLKTLNDLPLKHYKQVTMKLFSLQTNPFPQDYKKLKGFEESYRVDQGEYRILYIIDDDKIKVFKIGKRNDDEVYQNL
ncbi:type II toxin-antitoxin system RelE family toxin [Planktothrix mougeotii]|uniref:Type II toxin-antitoxin system RelE/ParE family toxin n=1 Tax=Planktothrix mougeotii LEGE 06226 TaxID=1828728 RepID=A0ABR9UB85_9CYAN|nr:type II toxin-antitoxin system RelE/ParE family toxin [Planktothrix mougeotii LEGE 06226]